MDIIYKCLKAGYLYKGTHIVDDKGSPQGSIMSPIFANIYLDALDQFIREYKSTFDKGTRRKANPVYTKMARDKNISPVERLKKIHSKGISLGIAKDPNYKRLQYVRYADDFLISIIGSYQDCIEVRNSIKEFLYKELKLDLNLEKTKITHATTERATFLGHEIHITPMHKRPIGQSTVIRNNKKVIVTRVNTTRPLLSVPVSKIVQKLIDLGYCTKQGNPTRVGRLIHNTDIYIINLYSLLWRGVANYYYKASNF
jgi:hypothetical protein